MKNMQLLTMIISLLGVLGLMFLMFFGLRMFTRRITTSGGRLRVIDRASLGRDSMMLVVSVCGKLMLVGVSSQRVEKIADLDMSEEEYVEKAFSESQNPLSVVPFSDILSTFMSKVKKERTNENVENIENENENENKQDS